MKDILSKPCRKADVNGIARTCLGDPVLLDSLVTLVVDNDPVYSHRSSWALNVAVKDLGVSVVKYYPALIDLLLKDKVGSGVDRNLLHILELKHMKEDDQGFFVDRCFTFLEDPNCAVAVRCLAMYHLRDFAANNQELISELIAFLDMDLVEEKAAFRAAKRKVLKELQHIEKRK